MFSVGYAETETPSTTPTPAVATTPAADSPAPAATPAPAPTAPAAGNGKTTPLPTPIGKVVWVKGASLKAVMGNNEERALQRDSILYLSDVLVTDDKTKAEIIFTDNTLMAFYENTKLVLEKYAFHQQSKKKATGTFVTNLVEGGFRTITGAIAKNNPDEYQVNTPVATIGVRGTDYAAMYRDGKLYVAFYKGAPCVTGEDKKNHADDKDENKKKTDKNKKKKEGTTKCLDKDHPYLRVPGKGDAPESITLDEMPNDLKDPIEITLDTMLPFSTPQGSNTVPTNKTKNGGGSGFCIVG